MTGLGRDTERYVIQQIEQMASVNPLAALTLAIEEIKSTTDSLIAAYYAKLQGDLPGDRATRWQRRTLSALRAALKAEARTVNSIRKLRRHMGSKGAH